MISPIDRESTITLVPMGHVRSSIVSREQAPKQGREGAPPAWIELGSAYRDASQDLAVGDEILLVTWLDRGDRSIQRVHPRDDTAVPMRGVFSTRSQDRPNPIGIHRVTILEVESPLRFKVSDCEAFDGTPVIDIKPVLDVREER